MRWWGSICAVAWVGCFAPTPPAGSPCAVGQRCPDPLVCDVRTMTCEREGGSDAGSDGSPGGEAAACAMAVGHDEDGDAIDDACDNCPHVANTDQLDLGETAAGAAADGIGDACDPNPASPGDRLVVFASFAVDPGWEYDSGWTIANDELVQMDTAGIHLALVPAPLTVKDFTIDIGITIDEQTFSAMFFSSSGSTVVTGASDYRCLDRELTLLAPQQISLNIGGSALATQNLIGPLQGATGVSRFSRADTELRCRGTMAGQSFDISASNGALGDARPGLRTQFTSARFQFVALYGR